MAASDRRQHGADETAVAPAQARGIDRDAAAGFPEDGHHVEQFSDWSAPADTLLERQQTRATVRACIMQLPDNYRMVLVLRDIEERSTQEVAETLAMTATAVKVRLHRARQALSTLLRAQFAFVSA